MLEAHGGEDGMTRNAANHEALRVGLVDTEMFQAAARYLVGLRLIQTGTDA